MATSAILYYAHDPMCSWCWGFRPCWRQVQANLPETVSLRFLLGGLAPDDAQAMSEEMRQYLQDTWRRIQQRIPGTSFNFDFWRRCTPRRATYPACRAVIAAGLQNPEAEQRMIDAIQRAYYEQARNPSDTATLVELARETGLDSPRFLGDLKAPQVEELLQAQIQQARTLAMSSFPSLKLEVDGGLWPIAIDYTNPQAILEQIDDLRAEA
jgi:putative protein-disulfide isomerase